MTARIIYTPSNAGAVPRLPSHAAFADEAGNPHVWVVDAETMKVQRKPVKLGTLAGDEVEILEGLADGDLVAVSGVGQLREGMQVRRYQN